MAAYAPTHLKLIYLVNNVHFLYLSMAGFTFKSAKNMPFMGEMGMLREEMDFYPGDRRLFIPILSNFLNFFLNVYLLSIVLVFHIPPGNVQMTPHTFLYRRYARPRGYCNIAMAVLTRDLIVSCMNLMAKENWLCWPLSAAFSSGIEMEAQKNGKRKQDKRQGFDRFAHFSLPCSECIFMERRGFVKNA